MNKLWSVLGTALLIGAIGVANADETNIFSKDYKGTGCTKPKPGGEKPACATDKAKKEEKKAVYGIFREDCYANYFSQVDDGGQSLGTSWECKQYTINKLLAYFVLLITFFFKWP